MKAQGLTSEVDRIASIAVHCCECLVQLECMDIDVRVTALLRQLHDGRLSFHGPSREDETPLSPVELGRRILSVGVNASMTYVHCFWHAN